MGGKTKAKRKAAAKKPTNFFDDLPSSPHVSDDEDAISLSSKHSDATPLIPCGTKNSDGTQYGGGPLDVNCGGCRKAGFPTAYGHGHRINQRQFCPVLQQSSNQQVAAKQLSPKLKDLADSHLPIPSQKAASIPVQQLLSETTTMSPDDVMMQLAEGILETLCLQDWHCLG